MKKTGKLFVVLLIVSFLFNGIVFAEQGSSSTQSDQESIVRNGLGQHAEQTDHSLIMEKLTEALHGLENFSKEELAKRLENVFPGVVILSAEEIKEVKLGKIDLPLLKDKTKFDQFVELTTYMDETIQKRALESDLDVYPDISYIIWDNNGELSIAAVGVFLCTVCATFVGAVLYSWFEYKLAQIGGWPAVETWIWENFFCAECNTLLQSTGTCVDLEYAPVCSICLSANNMGWSNGWYCTACNYN